MTIVADASAVASFLIPDEADAFSAFARERCAIETVYVPAHWPVELANIVWKANRRKRIEPADYSEVLRAADDFRRVVIVQEEVDISALVETALRTGLTAYDTAYLMLAERLHVRLLTRDVALARAATEAGVTVLAP